MSNTDHIEPVGAGSPSRALQAAAERDVAIRDADRLLMQIIQLSISLIGFGFTINAFFNGVAESGAVLDADQTARRLGLALLSLGLVFLAMGIWNQSRFRRSIWARYRRLAGANAAAEDGAHRYSAFPSFLLAVLLLIVGLAAFASIVFKMIT